jgi:hypothetical protein
MILLPVHLQLLEHKRDAMSGSGVDWLWHADRRVVEAVEAVAAMVAIAYTYILYIQTLQMRAVALLHGLRKHQMVAVGAAWCIGTKHNMYSSRQNNEASAEYTVHIHTSTHPHLCLAACGVAIGGSVCIDLLVISIGRERIRSVSRPVGQSAM